MSFPSKGQMRRYAQRKAHQQWRRETSGGGSDSADGFCFILIIFALFILFITISLGIWPIFLLGIFFFIVIKLISKDFKL